MGLTIHQRYSSISIHTRYLAYCSISLLVILLCLFLLAPTATMPTASAEEGISRATSEDGSRSSTNGTSTVSISTPSNLSLNLKPTVTGEAASSNGEIRIATTNVDEYRVFLSPKDNSTAMVNVDKSITASINPTPTQATLSNLPSNTWGYSINPTSSNALNLGSSDGDGSSSSNNGGSSNDILYAGVNSTIPAITHTPEGIETVDKYNLSIGIKANTTLPAGTYSNTMLISIVADPSSIAFSGITTMQEMTSAICQAAAEHETAQLRDIRDDNVYWVTKLKDGNCWMTQNLALDLSTTKTLTPEDTDVTANYTPNSNTNAVAFTGTAGNTASTNQYSWNIGKIVLVKPLTGASCNHYGNGNDAKSTDDLGTVCAKAGFINVSSTDWQPTFTAQIGNYSYDSTTNSITAIPNTDGNTLIAADTNAKTYDAHYLIGNYYQYNTVTAGIGNTVTADNANASSSICPKGWRLPTAGRQSNKLPLETGEFYKLLLAYGYPTASNYTVSGNDASTLMLSANKNMPDNITAPPMSFVRSGHIYLGYGYLRLAGNGSFSRSRTSGGSDTAYYFSFISSQIWPTTWDVRFQGFSARCLAE